MTRLRNRSLLRPLFGTMLAVLLLVVLVALIFAMGPLSWWLAKKDALVSGENVTASGINTIRQDILQVGAGVAAFVALAYTARNYLIARRTHDLAELSQATERFVRAMELLGSEAPDIRLGGIYALGRIARDSEKDQETIREVLTAFIHQHARRSMPSTSSNADELTPMDVTAAILVVVEKIELKEDFHLDLSGLVLTGIRCPRQYLNGINFTGATLKNAEFSNSLVIQSDFTQADLTAADLTFAHGNGIMYPELARKFRGDRDAELLAACFKEANLTGARLDLADLPWIDFSGARLIDVSAMRTNFSNANLSNSDLTGANLSACDFTNANLSHATLANANLLSTKLTNANLCGADLREAQWVIREEFEKAVIDNETKLPNRMAYVVDGKQAYYETA